MFHIALWEPEIPPNAGNVARLCAAIAIVGLIDPEAHVLRRYFGRDTQPRIVQRYETEPLTSDMPLVVAALTGQRFLFPDRAAFEAPYHSTLETFDAAGRLLERVYC